MKNTLATVLATLLVATFVLSTNGLFAQSAPRAEPQRKILTEEARGEFFVVKFDYYLNGLGFKIRHGTETRREIGGRLMSKGEWKDGERDGVWEDYQPNGSVRMRQHFRAGQLGGKTELWNDKGALLFESHYDDKGNLSESIRYHDNGRKAKQGKFLPKRNPSLIEFFPKLPEQDGTWTYWNKAGETIAEGVWKDGKPWSGVCGVPAAGDAGSAGGLESFAKYEEGKLVEQVKLKQ